MPSAYEPPEPAEVAVETQTLASKTQLTTENGYPLPLEETFCPIRPR